ncbi:MULTISPECIES: SLC13 family permease [Weissella]|uniref:Anion permease ArsB/NhaD-like n=2 Tax=Weissella TaxID=46255 RepID=A0A1L6RB28_9LACO|nr:MULTISPECIES: SLC13 family permease [Weissella]APS41688.1 Anion permease ArsB/NhaD-like [Weissella jogaejeotgali]NKY90522.1 carboxylate transporter [Weissella thailandensis]RDS60083.1 carboxylate transporter [Weissella thailandensis]GEP73824.1 anion permease [Weissella thailandensis]
MKTLVYKIINDRTLWVTTVLLILALFVGHVQLNDIDMQTILSLLSLMILISLYEGEGLLKYVALTIIKKCQTTRQVQLTVFLLVFFSAMFLTNDVAIITFIPIFVVIAQKIHVNAVLPIILLTVFANLGSAVTPFGNPQNIYLASHYQLQMGDFFQMSWPLGLISFLFVLLSSLFFRSSNLEQLTLDLPTIRPKQTKLLIAGSFVVLAGLLHLLPIMISLVVSILLTLVINKKRFLQVDYGIIILFVELFLIVGVLSRIPSVVSLFEELTTTDNGSFISGIVLSQFISNVPAAVLLSAFTSRVNAVYLGVSIGGLGTIIASLANLLAWRQYQRQIEEINYSFPIKLMVINLLLLLIFIALGYAILTVA